MTLEGKAAQPLIQQGHWASKESSNSILAPGGSSDTPIPASCLTRSEQNAGKGRKYLIVIFTFYSSLLVVKADI